MKFAIITDIHLGKEEEYKGVIRKLSHYSMELLQKFVHDMNSEVRPEFVVNLGDAINDISHEVDVENLRLVLAELNKLDCPVFNLVGNHEQWTMSKPELELILDKKPLYYSYDYKDYHLVFLMSEDVKGEDKKIDEVQVDWFIKDLEQNNKKTIVFVHHPFSDQDLTGNFWFDGRSDLALLNNRAELRKIIEDSKNVIAVFNGHVHWNHMDIHNDIPHFTINSIVENFRNDGTPSECYAIIEVDDNTIGVDIKGNDRQVYHYSLS